MNTSWNDQKITDFVRHVLGCGCPDEVFENIQLSRISLSDLVIDISRIDVGNTLLVYVVTPATNEQLQDAIHTVTSLGRSDRDRHGFNRFRLVVAGNDDEFDRGLANSKFAQEVGDDQKSHLHFVLGEEVKGL